MIKSSSIITSKCLLQKKIVLINSNQWWWWWWWWKHLGLRACGDTVYELGFANVATQTALELKVLGEQVLDVFRQTING